MCHNSHYGWPHQLHTWGLTWGGPPNECSDYSTRRLFTCIIGSFFSIHFIITLHSSIAATSAAQYKKKTKIEQSAINSCHVLQFHALQFWWLVIFMSIIFSAPVTSTSCSGANMRTILSQRKTKNGCHGNAGCLATGQLNLKFVASYFRNENFYKLPNRHIYSSRPPRVT